MKKLYKEMKVAIIGLGSFHDLGRKVQEKLKVDTGIMQR